MLAANRRAAAVADAPASGIVTGMLVGRASSGRSSSIRNMASLRTPARNRRTTECYIGQVHYRIDEEIRVFRNSSCANGRVEQRAVLIELPLRLDQLHVEETGQQEEEPVDDRKRRGVPEQPVITHRNVRDSCG